MKRNSLQKVKEKAVEPDNLPEKGKSNELPSGKNLILLKKC
jgi:hypothetical protein